MLREPRDAKARRFRGPDLRDRVGQQLRHGLRPFTPVDKVEDAEVHEALSGAGRNALSDVADNRADDYVSRYGHLIPGNVVRAGDLVFTGEPIGKMGNTGKSTGTHLHFEVLRNGRDISYMDGLITPVADGDEIHVFPPGR